MQEIISCLFLFAPVYGRNFGFSRPTEFFNQNVVICSRLILNIMKELSEKTKPERSNIMAYEVVNHIY